MPPRARRRLWKRLGIPADYARTRHMPLQRVARSLVSAGPAADDGKPVRLTPRAAAAWRRMRAAAAADDVNLLPLSGYRSLARQTRIIRQKLRAGQAIADILRLVAAPGCSEHHTGRAIDIGSPDNQQLDEDFAMTAEFRWLRKHAARFGFRLSYPRGNRHHIGYEPWHWCWRA
ncbi:MAG: D-alanyl-D-alanine carboxypeptidase family protein [Opitutaceae bacterium]|nr:D-alanyl-D-alanine carboxypeptidase family protein [Opitutaceae bacterium]